MDAFSKVDDLVSKPILGSDGAKAWQEFAKDNKSARTAKKSLSSAPQAPLKAQERSMGFTSWQEEQQAEGKRRLEQGLQVASTGYTHFKKKQPQHEKQQEHADKATGDKDNYHDNDDDDDNKKDKKQQSTTSTITSNDTTTTTTTTTTTSDRPRKKRKAAAAVTVVHDPMHPLEQVSAALQQKHQQAASNAATALPPGWHVAQDAASGKTYFYHATTGQRSWEKPVKTTETNSNNNNAMNNTLPEGWTTAQDPCTGNTYYYHAPTKIVQWHPPNQQT